MDTGCLDARVVGSGGCVSASSLLHSYPIIASCYSVHENASVEVTIHSSKIFASCFSAAENTLVSVSTFSSPVIASCSLVCSVNSNAYVEIDKHTLWLNPSDVFNISSNTNWIII